MSVNGLYFNKTDPNFELAYHTLLLLDKTNNNDNSYSNAYSLASSSPSIQIKRLELLVARNLSSNLLAKEENVGNTRSSPLFVHLEHLNSSRLAYDLNNDCLLLPNNNSATTATTTTTTNNSKSNQAQKQRTFTSQTNNNHQQPMMVLNTEWTQLEIIELLNETLSSSSSLSPSFHAAASPNSHTPANLARKNEPSTLTTSPPPPLKLSPGVGSGSGVSGFGFGITGNKSTGVVVKAITPGGSAFRVSFFSILWFLN